MAQQDLDSSSSYESGSSSDERDDHIETDSDSYQNKIVQNLTSVQTSTKPFSLPMLHNGDKVFQQKVFETYLQNRSYISKEKGLFLIDKTVQNIPSSFTPWWESWKANQRYIRGELSSTSTTEPDDESIFNNWFDKSGQGKDTVSWLCGPKMQSLQDKSTPVEDIDVPSIYTNVSHNKGRKALKKERKLEREKTTGKKWYDMKMPDVDGNTKMDMELLMMRRALDPKRFYKQNDRKGLPKYFQMGTVVDEGTDFYSSRLTKKQRKQTLVEELMADINIRKYNKKKYEELQQKQRTKKFSKKLKT